MFHYRHRRFPSRMMLFLGGFLLAALLFGSGGAAAAAGTAGVVGTLVVVPLLMLKMAFFLFVVGGLLRIAGFAGEGRWRHHRGQRPQRTGDGSTEDREWQDLLRQARQEVDDRWPDHGRPRPWTADRSPDADDPTDDDEGRPPVQD